MDMVWWNELTGVFRRPFGKLAFRGSGQIKMASGQQATSLRSIWLSSRRIGEAAQQELPGFGDDLVLMGRGTFGEVRTEDRDGNTVRMEFLLPIRFKAAFENAPRLVVLLDQGAGQAVCKASLDYRALTPDGFSLALLPRGIKGHGDARFYWLAVGARCQTSRSGRSILSRSAPASPRDTPSLGGSTMTDKGTMSPDHPNAQAAPGSPPESPWPQSGAAGRKWWLDAITDTGLPTLQFRQLRRGGRMRLFRCDNPALQH
ncbi:hypothetical protein [Szabonella alba]|uniref:Uncharacterized protein n=1 Tax=Szabonella alba TaxID=2804194 RepID=A0A8K0Y2A8_9RHOB|nr:hypothetical protein [Szabonella alba]MBL4919037.1 hypothetical protein [Szabonella alba]